MTTIATSLERCTLITLHERAPHTVPQAERLSGAPQVTPGALAILSRKTRPV